MPFSSSQVCSRQAGAGTLPVRPGIRKLNKTWPAAADYWTSRRNGQGLDTPIRARAVSSKEPWDDDPPMMKKSDVAWTLVGVSAVLLSGYLLYHEVRNISLTELADSLRGIGARRLAARAVDAGRLCRAGLV